MINFLKQHNQSEINKVVNLLNSYMNKHTSSFIDFPKLTSEKIKHFQQFWTKYFVRELESTINIQESKLSFLIKVGLETLGMEVYTRLGVAGRKTHLSDLYGFLNNKVFNLEIKKIELSKFKKYFNENLNNINPNTNTNINININTNINPKIFMSKTNPGQEWIVDSLTLFGYSAFLSPFLMIIDLIIYLYSEGEELDLKGVSDLNKPIFDKFLSNDKLHFKKYSDFEGFCKKNFIYYEIINHKNEFITKDIIEKTYCLGREVIDNRKLGYFILLGKVFWFSDLRFGDFQ